MSDDSLDRAFVLGNSGSGPCQLMDGETVIGEYPNPAAGADAWFAHPRKWSLTLRTSYTEEEERQRRSEEEKYRELMTTLAHGMRRSLDEALAEIFKDGSP